MKKIILAVDGDNFPSGAFSFVNAIQKLEPIFLSGIFIPELNYYTNSIFIPKSDSEVFTLSSVDSSMHRFQELCEKNNIEYTMNQPAINSGLTALKEASRFADLLVLGHEKFYGDLFIYGPYEFLGGALHRAECPVVVVPEKFNFPESVILSYDGTAASVFAIKSFSYLFPELCELPTILVYGSYDKSEIPAEDKIAELVGHHFKNISYQQISANSKDYFSTWLREIRFPIVISGAYGRSGLSRIFKHSFVFDIMKAHKVPIFMAH